MLGSVLSVDAPTHAAATKQPQPIIVITDDANRRLRIKRLPQPVLSSLRWPGRPDLPEGNPAWTYLINSPAR